MKNKKGFTLIEMLLTGTLLAIIAIIVVPNIVSTYKRAKENEYQRFLNDLFLSTEAYVQKYTDEYEDLKNVDGKAYIYVDELLDSRYLKSTLYDTKNKKHIKDESDFTIEVTKKEDGSYVYKLYEEHYTPIYVDDITQTLLDNNTTYGNYTYMGGTYLKGVQNNNYVWYNGFMWRIMGKNSDGTIRLITEENVTAIQWGAYETGLDPAYNEKAGYMNDWLNDYFYSHLNNTKNIIEDSTWCINTTTSGTSARTNCTGGSTFSSKVGLISIDEYNLSGASQTNNNYYLVNGQYFWTLTPYNTSSAWCVGSNVNAYNCGVTYSYGVRPVINVKAAATITTGDGTTGTPYMLEQANTNVTNKTLNEKATSGEYVELSDRIYRVVSKEEQGIKLILDGYYEETAGTVTNTAYGTNNTFAGSTIDTLLNGNVLTWLNSDKIIDASWNQGGAFVYGNPYTTSLTNSESNITRKVGLIRIGEMLSGQSSNRRSYWTVTSYTSTSITWFVNYYGYASNDVVASSYGVRPVIYVSGSNMIKSGTGVWNNPYIID